MSSSYWRRKPQKWHKSNKIRGYVPSAGGFSARTNKTGLPRQMLRQTYRPGKRTNTGGFPRTIGLNPRYVNPIKSVSRYKTSGLSGSRHGYAIALGRGGAPGRPIALGIGSGGKSTALARRTGTSVMRRQLPRAGRASWAYKNRRGLAIAGGVTAIGAVGYAAQRRRKAHRVRRNYKGQFAGSY